MIEGGVELGSFRDPSGHVYLRDGRIFRTVMPSAAEDFEYTERLPLIKQLESEGLLVESHRVELQVLGDEATGSRYVIEHPRLPFISYPYEWSFSALKTAGILHLDIHLQSLEHGITLADASAYNIQFLGSTPIFIDRLSFKRYSEGEFWIGHRQFCEQFLNPLLLRSLFDIPHNPWYRGAQEGISAEDMSRLLGWRHKLSPKLLTHVILPAALQRRATKGRSGAGAKQIKQHKLPKTAYVRMLQKLREWLYTLNTRDSEKTVWGDYATSHSYSSQELEKKKTFVAEFVESAKPQLLWDLGCNTGDYSHVSLTSGAENAIGFDFDQTALEVAFSRANHDNLNLLPLYFDAANPSPSQGWRETERKGLRARARADLLLALAFVHHLAIARNIPLQQLLDWLIDLAPLGVIEFVPKSDRMVQQMLELRDDIFADYTEEHFLKWVKAKAEIVKNEVVSSSGRRLIAYVRR